MGDEFNIHDMYSNYVKSVEIKRKSVQHKLEETETQLEYLNNILWPYSVVLEANNIKLNLNKPFNSKAHCNFYNERKLKPIKLDFVSIEETLLKNYILAFCKAKLRQRYLTEYLNDSKHHAVSFKIYKLVINSHNIQMSKRILNGFPYVIGSNLGSIAIVKLRRIMSYEGAEATKNIDWGETKKLRAKLISEGKSLYHPETNPTGEKYLVYYTSDYMYWFFWSRNDAKVKNAFLYTFTPTNYINTAERSQILFTAQCKSKDDILDSPLLGNRDKMNCLLRFDPNHGYNYITNERENVGKQQTSNC